MELSSRSSLTELARLPFGSRSPGVDEAPIELYELLESSMAICLNLESANSYTLRPRFAVLAIAAIAMASSLALDANASIQIAALGSAYSQDFNTLTNSGTSGVLPTGWYLSESGTSSAVDGEYAAGTGSSNAGNTYSFGGSSSTERAFGTLLSGTLTPVIGAQFTNATGGTITSLAISYWGEEWRLGSVSRQDRLDFQYSLDATSLTTGTWIDFDDLDFATPNTQVSGPKDGNAAINSANRSGTIMSLAIANSSVFWIRWTDFDASGADDGLAVDDFSLTADGVGGGAVPEMSSLIIWSAISASATFFVRRRPRAIQPVP